ncbi:MAG TPA: dienelactone hydrolase family protein [Acidimicrobiales bacterium]|nr:dienelactone hydrolase family protein [Acidimicrobiales bacterium]
MRIRLPSGTPAERAVPASGSATAGLVICPDIGGLRPLFDDMAQRLADDLGRVVVAPEPFPGREDLPLDQRLEAVADLVDHAVLADLASAAEATGFDHVDVVGFCLGGMYTFKAAGTGRFERAVAFYGMIRLPEAWQSPTQAEPLEALSSNFCSKTLAIIGTEDPYTPPDDVEALEATGVTVVRYEGAQHGFVHDPSRPAHRPDDAADAWSRTESFLTQSDT